MDLKYTCEELLETLTAINFAEIQEQGYIPLYKREAITDYLHEACGFRTDYQFITKSKMRTIQKKSKGKDQQICNFVNCKFTSLFQHYRHYSVCFMKQS